MHDGVPAAGLGGGAERANLGRRKVLARLEGDSRPFRQVVEPHPAHVSAPKHIAFAVLAEKRSHSSVLLDLRYGPAHRLCPICLRRCRSAYTRAAMVFSAYPRRP